MSLWKGLAAAWSGRAPAAPAPTPPAPRVLPDYEAMLEAFYSRLDLRDAEVVDVGAHAGRHAIPLARAAGMGGTVHAFEPLPHVRAQLAQNLAAGKCNNVVVYPFALSDRPRQASFTFVPNLPEESGLKRRHAYNATPSSFEEIPVKVMRLQDALPEGARVRFIKIDVEGGELDVLRGSVGILERCRPVVAFECGAASYLGYHDTPDEIFEIFRSRGYAVHAITGEVIADLGVFREATRVQAFWDYVAFPPGEETLARLLAP